MSTSTRCTFTIAPTHGTLAGYHQYDTQLEDYSRKNIDAEIAALKGFEKRIEAIHPDADAGGFCATKRPRDCAR